MARLLVFAPWIALGLAAVDVAHVRLAAAWRPAGPRLGLQALLLWALFVLVALPFAAASLRATRRSEGGDADGARERAPFHLLAWSALPVLLHTVLDRHVGLEGSLAALGRPRPWLELLGTVLLGLAVLLVLARLAVLRPRPSAAGVALLAGLVLLVPGGGGTAGAPATAADGPNLLLLVWDTARADRLSPYGAERETTPHLARLADQSVVFENAVSPSAFTFSSHLSLLSGVRPSTHGARLLSTRYDPRRATLVAESLRRAGWRTGAFVGTDVLSGHTGIRHGFEVYDDRVDPPVCDTAAWALVHDVQALLARLVPALRGDGQPHLIQDFQRPAAEVLAKASAWIAEDDPRPWFCFVNLYDVHWPYVPTGPGQALVGPYDGPLDGFLFRSDDWVPGTELGEADRRHVLELYEGELLELDLEVDRFLSQLGLERGDTAVLLTSDHGEAFGEAGRWKHEDITEPQVRIPLLVRPPGTAPAGRRSTAPVSGIDVAPTLYGLAGVEPPDGLEGRDLLGGELDPERLVLVEDRDHLDPRDVRVALYRGPWKLVRRGLGEEASHALYDLKSDPVGEHDVAAEHPEVAAELRALLDELRREADRVEAGAGAELRGQADALRALGYAGE